MTFTEALHYLQSLESRGWRLGLERMHAFVEGAGLGSAIAGNKPKFIHVAGTNGKGSTTAFIHRMLRAAGYNAGAFFSPYVVDPRERVWINDDMISEREFVSAIEELIPLSAKLEALELGGVTEFEFKTAIGFLTWYRHQMDWVALEVGLGGRLDSTNVICPRACVIVSIGLDHVHILGDTLEQIAYEKAGIIKRNIPVIVGDVPDQAWEVIERIANNLTAPIWRFGKEIRCHATGSGSFLIETPWSQVSVSPSLHGTIQGHNAALAYASMEFSGAGTGQTIANAAESTFSPGRFQSLNRLEREFIVDGAHNGEAAAILAEMIRNKYPARIGKLTLIAGMVSGHDVQRFFGPLLPLFKSIHLVPIDSPRAINPQSLATSLDANPWVISSHLTLQSGIEAALQDTKKNDPIIVTGSFYLAGDVLRKFAD